MIRLALRVERQHAELVLAELLELASSGVEEAELPDGRVEYAIYGAEGELPELPDLRAAAKGALCEISTSTLPDDWQERWKSFHKPVLIEPLAGAPLRGLYVRAPWIGACEREDVQEIVIDPGQAFGTGSHATTKLCLQMLLDLRAAMLAEPSRWPSEQRVLDLGTGSGILAIAASKLGFHPVLGFDHERESVAAAQQNAACNAASLEVRKLDLRTQPLPSLQGSVVLANLLRPLLLEIAAKVRLPPRELLMSGLLIEEADEVSAAFRERLALTERARSSEGEWAGLWLSLRAPL